MILNFGAENDFKASVVMTTLEVAHSLRLQGRKSEQCLCVRRSFLSSLCATTPASLRPTSW